MQGLEALGACQWPVGLKHLVLVLQALEQAAWLHAHDEVG